MSLPWKQREDSSEMATMNDPPFSHVDGGRGQVRRTSPRNATIAFTRSLKKQTMTDRTSLPIWFHMPPLPHMMFYGIRVGETCGV